MKLAQTIARKGISSSLLARATMVSKSLFTNSPDHAVSVMLASPFWQRHYKQHGAAARDRQDCSGRRPESGYTGKLVEILMLNDRHAANTRQRAKYWGTIRSREF